MCCIPKIRYCTGCRRKTFDSCAKCGLTHVIGKCRAINAICNMCFKKGHYGRVCRNKRDSMFKSDKAKQRDTVRAIAFKNRLVAQTSMPFYQETNEYLRLNTTNSDLQKLTINKTVVAAVKVEINQLRKTLTEFEAENHRLCTENRTLKDKHHKLTNYIDESKTITKQQEQKLRPLNGGVRELQSRNEQQEIELQHHENKANKLKTLHEELVNKSRIIWDSSDLVNGIRIRINQLQKTNECVRDERNKALDEIQSLKEQSRISVVDDPLNSLKKTQNGRSRGKCNGNVVYSNTPPNGLYARRGKP